MNRFLATIFMILLVALGLSALSCNRDKTPSNEAVKAPPEHAKVVEAYRKSLGDAKKNTVATVNGVNITAYDLVNEMNMVGQQYIKPGQKKDPQVDEKVSKEALDRLIYRELAVQEAGRQGLKPPAGAVEDELKKMKAALKTEDAYRNKLANDGLTEEELKKQLERSILVDMITEHEIFDKVKIDPKLVKKTYDKEKGSYKGPSGRMMSFEEAQPLIEEKLLRPLVQKREDEWIAELKKAAKIDIIPNQAVKEIHSTN